MTTATYSVDGMTCAHCVHHVTSEITALPGVSDVHIDLVVGGPSSVTVTSEAPLDPTAVEAAVVEAGYVLAPKNSLL